MKAQDQAGTNKRLSELEAKMRNYDKMAAELKNLRDLHEKVNDHEERIERIEKSGGGGSGKDTGDNLIDRIKELEFELKQLAERIKDLQEKLNSLLDTKDKYVSSGGDPDDDNEDTKNIEETRKQLENELRNLKGRMTQIEDKLKLLIMKLENLKKESMSPDDDDDPVDGSLDLAAKHSHENQKKMELTSEIDILKKKLQDLEELLKKLKKFRSAPVAKDGVDYLVIIEELRDDMDRDLNALREKLNKVEDDQSKTEFRSQNNESRIEKLEADTKDLSNKLSNSLKDSKNNKSSIEELEKKLAELKEQVGQKVDCEDFEKEINSK